MVTENTAPPKQPAGKRIFVIDGREFKDPNPTLTVDQVRQHYANFYPDLANAEASISMNGNDDVITFTKRVGSKGDHHGEV